MGYKWKPSKTAKREFAKQMDEIRDFCSDNSIEHSANMDSYYFIINGRKYRVSNHTVEKSNSGAYNKFGEQVRGLYHPNGREEGVTYIHAGKTRLIEIYKALESGYQVDGRGNRI